MSSTFWIALALGVSLGTGGVLILLSFAPQTPRKRVSPGTSRLRRLLDEAGQSRLPVSAFLTAVVLSAGVTFFLVYALTRAAPIAACLAIFASLGPWAALRWQGRRRRAQLAQVWPDVVDHLRSAIRSGLSLPEGLIQLSHSGPEPLRAPFAEFARDWRAGQPMATALAKLKDRLADPVGDRIILALQITRELGGSDLGRLLNTLSEVLRDAAKTRSELEARQSWTVNAAKLAVAAPWLVVLLLGTQSAAAEAYRGAQGMLVLGAGLVVSLVCYRIMLRIGALPQEGRVLA